jgi:hypothetical protein
MTPYGLAVQIKKWYDFGQHVVLYRDSRFKVSIKPYTGVIPELRYDEEQIMKFKNISSWSINMVRKELKKLKLGYPLRINIHM